jgi:hypothetical protein
MDDGEWSGERTEEARERSNGDTGRAASAAAAERMASSRSRIIAS